MFHTINAYEQGNEIILDACTYLDSSIIDALYLEARKENAPLSPANTIRFQLPLHQGSIKATVLSDQHWDLPRINYAHCSGQAYRYFFCIGSSTGYEMLDTIIKYDLNTQQFCSWHQDGVYVGEALFVAKPNGSAEDDGVVLSIIIDAKQEQSALVILDGRNLEELARLTVPHIIPFGLHGNFKFV